MWSLKQQYLLGILVTLVTSYMQLCMATADCGKLVETIKVDIHGRQKFTSIQKAIDSIPSGNNRWIRILISWGYYAEKVEIPKDKGCIFLEGEKGKSATVISWGDHNTTASSPTFTAHSDNIAAKGITFKNSYAIAGKPQKMKQAVAVALLGDRYAFYKCGFVGLQDTIWDQSGRHYFKSSTISGAVDFIWGAGQSIYEGCQLFVTLGKTRPKIPTGILTAQGRESESDPGGFVFKGCSVTGDGNTLLGRAYRQYSRVIFYQSDLSNIVHPQGWDAWTFKGHEDKITYVESGNKGAGADTSKRVEWMTKMSDSQLLSFVSMSYIDHEGWISKLPVGALS